jgi:ankyrin repeat protein
MPRLIDAVTANDQEKVDKLLSTSKFLGGYKGSDAINTEKSSYGVSSLYTACTKGFTEICKMLLESGAKSLEENVFFIASVQGHIPIMKLLLEHGENVESPRLSDGASALYMASFLGKIDVVNFLIENKANVNLQIRKELETPLHIAIKKGHLGVCRALLSKGADIHLESKNGTTPYQLSLRSKNEEIINVFEGYIEFLNIKLSSHLGRIVSLKDKQIRLEASLTKETDTGGHKKKISYYKKKIKKHESKIIEIELILNKAFMDKQKAHGAFLYCYSNNLKEHNNSNNNQEESKRRKPKT